MFPSLRILAYAPTDGIGRTLTHCPTWGRPFPLEQNRHGAYFARGFYEAARIHREYITLRKPPFRRLNWGEFKNLSARDSYLIFGDTCLMF